MIEIENGTTLPYTVWVEGEATGLHLTYKGLTNWKTPTIRIPGRRTARPANALTYVAPGSETLSCSTAELNDLRTGSATTHSLGFSIAITVI
jgi:hypothetical protein